MPLQVDAIYEGGVLRPSQPLDLSEHEHVVVRVVQTGRARRDSMLDEDLLGRIKKELEGSGPAPGIDEVRRRLSTIPGSMAEAIIAERVDY